MSADALGDLIRMERGLVDLVRRDRDRILSAPLKADAESGDFSNFNYKLPSYMLAWLYRFPHPENTLHGQAWAADLAIALVDRWVDGWYAAREEGHRTTTSEWPIFATVEVLDFLGDRVAPERRARWLEFVAGYLDHALERPFGFTAPNHEIWRTLALYRGGQVAGRADWREAGLFFCRQLLAYQTAEGFWEEGRHHGPSMRYNSVMLTGLAVLYRLSGEAAIGEAARRLAAFMSTYTFPDGITIGAFDGRQSTSLAYYMPVCAGLELVPEGRTLNARGLRLWREAGGIEDIRLACNSSWYIYFGSFFGAVACRYYAELLPDEERRAAFSESAPLSVDREGVIEHHTPAFDGLLFRRGAWSLGLSSQNSDLPLAGTSIYRLDRQSRIELWHREARLVVGGGHNRRDWSVPYANVILDTGSAGEAAFGVVDPVGHPPRRGYYLPRLAGSHLADGAPVLELTFAHGTVLFRFAFPDDQRCRIEARWEVRHLERLCLQIPLIVWRGATLRLDGVDQSGEAYALRPVRKVAQVTDGLWGSSVSLRVPEGADDHEAPKGLSCRVHYPLDTLRVYGGREQQEEREPPFRMALVSCQWDRPDPTGEARFDIAT